PIRTRSPAGSRVVPLDAPFQTCRVRSDAAGFATQRIESFCGAAVASVVEPANRVKGQAAVGGDKLLLMHARAPSRAAGENLRVTAAARHCEGFEAPTGAAVP